ncbi:Tetraspanin-4 [Collichthys lucidus]|uniref:Tetraspanin-4 n=1 Tax=Collichthys lucidus TaxID=240159 RepID=A0A4V6ASF6_COLLU|nr:Tetraspanin-4 [Collichthys lucidus]
MTRLLQGIWKNIRRSDNQRSRRKIVNWMPKWGILKRGMKCGKCNGSMYLEKSSHVIDGLRWICKHHKSSPLSVRKGSIFARSHTPLAKWLEFILRKATDVYVLHLKACVAGLKRLRKTGMKIGGRHRFVVVDESKFAHKRKYHRGRCGITWRRDCQWVFGMLEVDGTSRRPILRLVKDRSRKTLIKSASVTCKNINCPYCTSLLEVYDSHDGVIAAANLLLVAGGITMVTGFLGCLGALKEQRCLLFMFFVILLLLVLTEVTLMLVIHIFHDKFKCCGVTNKTDWYDVLNGTLPSSCCSVGTDQCVDGWSEPCYQKARQWLLDNIPSVLVFGVCIGVVQILALVFSMLMYCQILCAEKHLE